MSAMPGSNVEMSSSAIGTPLLAHEDTFATDSERYAHLDPPTVPIPAYKPTKEISANTGGGRLYRFFLCGRRDTRKETATGLKTKKAAAFEGLDFDDFVNPVTEAHLRAKTGWQHQRTAIMRWLLNFIIGITVALVAVAIIYCSKQFILLRFGAVNHLINQEKSGNLPSGLSFVVFWLIGLVYAVIASYPVIFIEPASGGAGIPEVKMILNGVKMPRITRVKTLICRVFGNIFSVASGLPVGYEGPMISIGAAVAAGISQGKSTTMGLDTRWSVYSDFRNDKEKRDFIVSGCSAGVSAAFNSPVGGTLFSYEESASFWHKNLTWRAFFTSMVSAYTIDFLLSGINDSSAWGQLTIHGMFRFGLFDANQSDSWYIWELPLFILMGAAGGIFGALFVHANKYLTMFRIAKVNPSKWRRLSDVIFMKTLVSGFCFFLPYLLGTCKPIPTNEASTVTAVLVPFYCANGEYNDIASMWFTAPEDAIRQLYHFSGANPMSLLHLGVFFLAYTTLMCLAAGTSVPAGLFIPTLLAGSALGRFAGEAANLLLPGGMQVDAGTYALIGSAALLGGTTRMTISLAVILAECTGNYQYGLPIMLTLMAARFTGNIFSHGLYDMQIELRKWPILEDKVKKTIVNELRASDVMTEDLLVLSQIEKVGRVFDALKKTDFSGFPVIFSEEMLRMHPRLGDLAGYIQRKHLAVLLAKKAFHIGLPAELVVNGTARSGSPGTGTGTGTGTGAGGTTLYPLSPVLGGHTPHTSGGGGGGTMTSPGSGATFGSPGVLAQPGPHTTYSAPGVSTLDSRVEIDDRDTNERALQTAATGRSRPSIRHIRLSSHSQLALPINGGVASSQSDAGARQLRYRNNTSAGARGGGTVNRSGVHMLLNSLMRGSAIGDAGPEDDDTPEVPEPVQSAALYNALYEGEFRYPNEPLLHHDDFEASYPRYPDVASITITAEEREMYLDLRPYMDPTPMTVHLYCPLSRAYHMFRDLGLRHLLVTNNCADAVGIISRSNLTMEFLRVKYAEVRAANGDSKSTGLFSRDKSTAAATAEAGRRASTVQSRLFLSSARGLGEGGGEGREPQFSLNSGGGPGVYTGDASHCLNGDSSVGGSTPASSMRSGGGVSTTFHSPSERWDMPLRNALILPAISHVEEQQEEGSEGEGEDAFDAAPEDASGM